jgi:hypothetical protein
VLWTVDLVDELEPAVRGHDTQRDRLAHGLPQLAERATRDLA